MKFGMILVAVLACISCASNRDAVVGKFDPEISESYVIEVTRNKLHKETVVLVCYNDNYRKCQSDESVEACVRSLKIHEPLVRKASQMRYPNIQDREMFSKYADEYTKRTLLVRAYVDGRQDIVVPCLKSNPVYLEDSEANMKADDPENVIKYLSL